MTEYTHYTYPLHSEDHPKFGKTANIAPILEVSESAITQDAAPQGLGLDSNFASTVAAAYQAKHTVRKLSVAGTDFREFLARRNQRQDSQATLIDVARRPSRTNEGKFRLNVVPSETGPGTPPLQFSTLHGRKGSLASPGLSYSPDLKPLSPVQDSGEWGKFNWRPSLNPLQPVYARPQRLDSDATLVDTGSWQRRGSRQGSRSGSFSEEPFRRRQSSDVSMFHNLQRPRLRQGSLGSPSLRQGSFLAPSISTLPETPDTPSGPELEIPKPVQLDTSHQLERLIDVDYFTDRDRGLLIGGVKPINIDDEDDNQVAEPELAIAEPQAVTQDPKSTHQEQATTTTQESFIDRQYPEIADPVDPCRILNRGDLIKQRTAFSVNIGLINFAMLIFALLAPKAIAGRWVLCFILFIKAKDCISAVIGMFYVIYSSARDWIKPPPPVESKWILSLIPAYSEEEEMIKNCVFSLRDNDAQPHKQVMCIVLDGRPRNIKQYMRVTHSFKRNYVTSRFKRNQLEITAGFMEDVPVICFEKMKNSGKKDSLILCHDLFNVMRDNAPLYTKILREEIEKEVLPTLVGKEFPGFDMVFCTDADSVIHKGAVAGLANAIARDPKAIASCGLVLVELEPGAEWSFWNLYQQFQYNFGQFVRRQAESVWGKVTCLPGCITMIAVRPEMAGAIKKYAAPITAYPVLLHQVQYLGTDRRLTYSMLSQSKDLHTLFVPSAVSETVAPQSVKHYLSQRRRWGSNAYFNNYFYFGGENMIWITRLWACIEVVRLTLVYYRVANTAMFIHGLISSFNVMSLIPLLVVSQVPTLWFLCNLVINPHLRVRSHKILLGLGINKFMGPVMSVLIFTNVVKNLGSQAWGMTHPAAATTAVAPITEKEKTSENLLQEERKDSVESIIMEEELLGTSKSNPFGSSSDSNPFGSSIESNPFGSSIESNPFDSQSQSQESDIDEMDQIDPKKRLEDLAAGL